MEKVKAGVNNFFKTIGSFFNNLGEAVTKGDLFVKLSLIWMGAGYARRKQYLKSLLVTIIEVLMLIYTIFFAPQYVSKFGTLGTIKQESVFNIQTMKNEFNDYDHSFLILLISLVSFVVWFTFIAFYLYNMTAVYKLQQKAARGEHINTFIEDCKELINKKFHVTLLTLPILGIVIFTIIPLLVMILVAFTNYDQ